MMVQLTAGKFPFKSVFNQFLGALAVNLITIGHGVAVGWVSPFLPYLQSNSTHLASGPVSVEQGSWIGAALCIGGFFGTPFFGLLASSLGKKRSLQLVAIPQLAFWLCVYYGTHVYHLYLARVLAGMGGGGLLRIIPLYIADIADTKHRGMLGALLIISMNSGVLICFILGNFLHYHTVPMVAVALPALFIGATCCLPETPYCLLKSSRTELAERSLMFYRGIRGHFQKTDQFRQEFEQLKKAVNAESDKTDGQNRLDWKDFCTKPAKKGLTIGLFLMILNQFSGALAIITYSATIFNESGSDLTPNESSIIVALIQLAGTLVSFTLVDNLGRKVLLLISTIGTTLGLFSMGLFSFLSQQGWDLSSLQSLPIVSLSFTILLTSIGIYPLPYVILAEVLPNKIRNIGSTIGITTVSLSAFVILKLFPVLIEKIHLHGTMWTLSAICVVGTFFILFVVPETKGKNLVTNESDTKPDKA
ncbi:facilitated trehalose transporter Tret1-like [Uranotaenia lowii]|uniref:facilitated trehalose transporter Tret1-like n=1 Tax=Uranotaenia lowii TaxID=190385 RepID=UPI00247A60E0|nr:facilitated trehalose transporter Tret1-like [Uranotaenia lowii]